MSLSSGITAWVRLVGKIAMATTVAGLLLGRGATPVAATNFTVPFDHSWTQLNSTIDRCVIWRLHGSISYSLTQTSPGNPNHPAVWLYSDIVLNDPIEEVHTFFRGAPGHTDCGAPRAVDAVTMSQTWSGYGCSFNPSITFGAPWSFGFSAWPDCGNKNVATYTHPTFEVRSDHYKVDNAGSPSGIPDKYVLAPYRGTPVGPCYGAYQSGDVMVGPNDATWNAGNEGNDPLQACLYKH